jgi:hypothetical protein
MRRKRQIIEAMLEDLYDLHEQMIEAALEYSDYSESKIVINYIMEKK